MRRWWVFGGFALFAVANSSVDAAETTTYVYDELGRLVAVHNAGGPRNGKSALTEYDPGGNRAAQSVGVPLPPPPVNSATFSIFGPPAVVDEGQQAVFSVVKSGTAGTNLSVNFSTADGSATSGGDFEGSTGTLTFRTWETVKTISIPVIVDGYTEPAESFAIQLSAPTPGATLGQAVVSANISASTDGAPQGGPNTPPVTAPNSVSVGVCLTATVDVVANDSDPDGDTLHLVSAGSSTLADLSIASPTTIAVSAYGSPGMQSATYTVSDGRATASGTLNIQILSGSGCN